jgi:hypothetical protein
MIIAPNTPIATHNAVRSVPSRIMFVVGAAAAAGLSNKPVINPNKSMDYLLSLAATSLTIAAKASS